jgi:hypothetical protein
VWKSSIASRCSAALVDPPYRTTPDVQPQQRQRRPRNRLVAGGQARQPVELVPSRHQLDRVRHDLPQDQRRFIPCVPIVIPSLIASC